MRLPKEDIDTNSLNPHEAEAAKLCCKIIEIINNVKEN